MEWIRHDVHRDGTHHRNHFPRTEHEKQRTFGHRLGQPAPLSNRERKRKQAHGCERSDYHFQLLCPRWLEYRRRKHIPSQHLVYRRWKRRKRHDDSFHPRPRRKRKQGCKRHHQPYSQPSDTGYLRSKRLDSCTERSRRRYPIRSHTLCQRR